MNLITFSPAHKIAFEPNLVNKFCDQGLDFYILNRDKLTKEEVRALVAELKPEYKKRIILQNHIELVNELDLGGVYVSSSKVNSLRFRWFQLNKLRKEFADKRIFFSYAGISDFTFKETKRNEFYLFKGLFNPYKRYGLNETYQTNQFNDMLSNPEVNVIGMGNVCRNILSKVSRYKLDGVVLNSVIWKSRNPINSFTEIVNIMRPGEEVIRAEA